MLALIRRLGKLTSLKLLSPDTPESSDVVDKLRDDALLRDARLVVQTLQIESVTQWFGDEHIRHCSVTVDG